MEFFLQLLVDGLTLGSLYALIALGFTMVYGILLMINFAHAEMFMSGGFIGYGILNLLSNPETIAAASSVISPLSFLNTLQPFFTTTAVGFIIMMILVFGITALLVGCLGVIIERLAYRPLRKAPRLCPLISALGISMFLQNFVLLTIGHRLIFPMPEFMANLDPVPLFGYISIAPIDISIFVTAIILLFVLDRFVSMSRLGKAMRATSQDKDAAGLMGININSIIALTFFIGPALGAIAGIFSGMKYGIVMFNMGFAPGIKAFTAAVVGGIGNLRGAMLGGFTIGILDAMSAGYISVAYREVITFAVLILVLIFRPGGLLGESVVEKV
jgi:branched-chain amino acid transport system permease protein